MKKYIGEFLGTMLLTFFACGTACILGCTTIQGIIGTSLAFGLVIIVSAYGVASESGCHINPAVSISLVFAGKMKATECVKYIISQILGAFAGSLLLGYFLGSFEILGANGYGNTLPNGTEVDLLRAIIIEVILTFIFITTILAVTSKKETSALAGIIIGLTLVVIHIIGIPFTGTSVNPARSLAPAILQGGEALKQVWVFILAPTIGAIISGIFYRYILSKKVNN